MPVARHAEISHVVVARPLEADGCRSLQDAVVVVLQRVALAVAVVHDRALHREAEPRPVLQVSVDHEDIVVAQRRCAALDEVVEAAVGVLVDAAEPCEVVLDVVVVPDTEQARAEQAVVEQESTEIRGEGLHADTQAVEVVARRHVAQVLVDEGGLDADRRLGARLTRVGIGLEQSALLHHHMRDVDRWREPELPVGRLEHRIALVEHGLEHESLRIHLLAAVAEGVEGSGAVGERAADRQREVARFDHRIRDTDQRQEPVVAEHGYIALQPVLAVVGVEQVLFEADRLNDAPSVGQTLQLANLLQRGRTQPRGVARIAPILQNRHRRAASPRIGGLDARTRILFDCRRSRWCRLLCVHRQRGGDGEQGQRGSD